MKKENGRSVLLVWPGGAFAGMGVFRDTGPNYPNTYQSFFDRYNEGVQLILPGSAQGGGSQGVRAQVGGGEGHTETTLSPCLMRAASDPNNPWGITPDDVSQANINLTLLDFQALEGKKGLQDALRLYGSDTLSAGRGSGEAALRTQLAEAQRKLGEAQGLAVGRLNIITQLLGDLEDLGANTKKLAPAKGKGQFADGLRNTAAEIAKLVEKYDKEIA